MKKPAILFLLDNHFVIDRRVQREAKTLIDAGYPLTLLAVHKATLPDTETIDGVTVHRILRKDIFDIKQSSCFKKYAEDIIKQFDFEIIHAHDQIMLHLATQIKKRKPAVKIVYDSHELFHAWPMNTMAKGWLYLKSNVVRFLLKRREAKNIQKASALITVNEPIRTDILDYYHLNIPSVSIRNLPLLPEPLVHKDILRKKFNLKEEDKILVYIGANIYPNTINIEQVIDEFANKENVYMIFICAFNWGKNEVEKYAIEKGVKNLYFHDLIPGDQIPNYLCDCTAGIVSSWNKKDLAYWYGLDNKLFEYMMAEIPIVATEQPEYIKIVRDYNIGICINPEIENYYEAFEKIIEKADAYAENLIAAKQVLNWENESKKLLNFYAEFIVK